MNTNFALLFSFTEGRILFHQIGDQVLRLLQVGHIVAIDDEERAPVEEGLADAGIVQIRALHGAVVQVGVEAIVQVQKQLDLEEDGGMVFGFHELLQRSHEVF